MNFVRRGNFQRALISSVGLLLPACGQYAETGEPIAEQQQAASDQEAFVGILRVTIIDPLDEQTAPHTEAYLELTDGTYLPIDGDGVIEGAAESGQLVRVFGRRDGGRITVDRLEAADAPASSASEELLEVVTPNETVGTKKIAVLLVSVSGATNNFDPDDVRDAVFGASGRSSRTFWEEGSFGNLTITGHLREDGDVFGPYTIAGDCSYGNVVNASAQAAAQAGVDLSPYDHIVRYTPQGANGCAGGGQGDQPGRNSIIFGIGLNALWDYVGHEVGHNFGCGHASSYDNCQGRFEDCQHNEYGDPTDIMGRRNGHYMSFYKDALGWLEAENKTTVSTSRRLRLFPIEAAADGLQSVLVPRDDGSQLHLEFRRPVGFDAFLENGLTNGVLLRYLPPDRRGLPHLINFGSGNAATDAALRPGTTFTDGNRDISVVEVGTDSAVVDIIIDGAPPVDDSGTGGAGGAGTGGSGETGGTGSVATGGSGGSGATGGFGGSCGAGGFGASGGTNMTGGAAATGGSGGGATGGSGGTATGTGGFGATASGGSSAATGAGAVAGTSTSSSGGSAAAASGDVDGGCGCSVPGQKRGAPVRGVMVGLALAAFGVRRRGKGEASSRGSDNLDE